MAWFKRTIESGSTGGGSGSATMNQLTKLGVIADGTTPKKIDIEIPETPDFNVRVPVVLKFITAGTNLITTYATFSNAESSDFNADSQVIFDGQMKLKTSYSDAMTNEGMLGAGIMFSAVIDKTQYKSISTLGVV